MEWNCAQCSSRCLREMEDSVCVFVKDFSRMQFPKEAVKAYLKKNRRLPTLRFCLQGGWYLVARQVGPLFGMLGHLHYGMAEINCWVDCPWPIRVGYYDYWNEREAIPPQYHSIGRDGGFTAAGYAVVREDSQRISGEWVENYVFIDRTGHNTSGNIFQEIGMIDASDFSMFGPYDDLLGYSVRMGTKYGFADFTGHLFVPCEYEREIHLLPVAGQYQFAQGKWNNRVVPLPEAGPGHVAIDKAIQKYLTHEALDQRPDPLGESAELLLRETGLFEEPISIEKGQNPACPHSRHLRLNLQEGLWVILRCTWIEKVSETACSSV